MWPFFQGTLWRRAWAVGRCWRRRVFSPLYGRGAARADPPGRPPPAWSGRVACGLPRRRGVRTWRPARDRDPALLAIAELERVGQPEPVCPSVATRSRAVLAYARL